MKRMIRSTTETEKFFDKYLIEALERRGYDRQDWNTLSDAEKYEVSNLAYKLEDADAKRRQLMKRYIRSTTDPSILEKIRNASYGEDAVKYVFRAMYGFGDNKLDGAEYDGSGFDVSYQGSYDELEQEIVDTFRSAGIDLDDGYSASSLQYDNDGQIVEITIRPGNDDYTFTDNSNGFYVSVENLYEQVMI